MKLQQFKKLKSGQLVSFQQGIFRVLSSSGVPTGLMCASNGELTTILTVSIYETTETFTFVKFIEGFKFETNHFDISQVSLIDNQN